MNAKPWQRLLLLSLVAFPFFATTAGCGSKDVDPNATVNEPGYYNGPMKAHGADSKSDK